MKDFVFLTIPLFVLWSWLLPIGFANRTIEGDVIRTMPISLLSRMKRHALTTIVTICVTVGLIALDLASAWWLLLIFASAIAILAVPQRYVVTTRGIRTGWGNFHRWTEFAGVHRSAAGATLKAIRRGPGLPIWLSGSRDDDEFVHLLRTLIRDSYKGKLASTPSALPTERATSETTSTDFPGIAAFQQER